MSKINLNDVLAAAGLSDLEDQLKRRLAQQIEGEIATAAGATFGHSLCKMLDAAIDNSLPLTPEQRLALGDALAAQMAAALGAAASEISFHVARQLAVKVAKDAGDAAALKLARQARDANTNAVEDAFKQAARAGASR